MSWQLTLSIPFIPDHQVVTIVNEYFASGDIGEVAVNLEDLGAAGFMHYFVKRLLLLALDRKDREREMTSVLLSSLYAEVSQGRAAHGF